MWGVVSGIASFFTGGSSAASRVLDGAVAGIDKLVYTPEEQAEARAKLMDGWIDLQKSLGEETSIRGVTRRILAVMFSGAYILLSLAAVAVWKFDQAYADFMWDIANGTYGTITLAVVGFYFGPYFLSKLVTPFTGKKQE